MKRLLIVAAILPIMSFGDAHVERIFLKPSHSKGEVGLADNYPIDIGKWIWHPEIAPDGKVPPEGVFLRFHLDFDAIDGEKLRFDVCADERYMLRLDGEVISRGPNRGSVNNWQFQSYEAQLSPGRHSMDALVWRLGEESSPIAQESWKGAFVVKAEGAYHKTVSTGVSAPWRVGRVVGTTPREPNEVKLDAFGVGCAFNVRGTFAAFEEPECWHGTITNTAWVRERLWKGHGESSVRPNGWQLYPSQMPDQLERFISPGAFKCVRKGAFDDSAEYSKAGAADPRVRELNALLAEGRALVVPPKTEFSAIWHLGDYQCGYPVLKAAGGKGAEIRWGWAESMFTPGGKAEKGDRAAFDGLVFKGIEDAFFPDGRKGAVFSVPWWRCGLWCRIDVKTAGEPLEITRLGIVESRYPLEDDGAFECDDESLAAVRRNCLRALQMCSHETTMDCPYYEQQQYPGDSRPELMAMCAFTADDRLVRRVVESFDFVRHEPYELERTFSLQEDGFVIIEGIHALNPRLTEGIPDDAKFRVFVEPRPTLDVFAGIVPKSTDVRFLRRMVRDNQFRKMNPATTVGIWPKVLAGEDKWINPFRENADATFDSYLEYEIAVLKPYVGGLLERARLELGPIPLVVNMIRLMALVVATFPDAVPGDSIIRETIGGSQLEY